MASKSVIKTVREQIVDRLRSDILSGELSEDEPVREAQLAERFGVSRGPIRDALLQLSQEGGLLYQPNCGMRVSPVREESDRELFARIRADLECHALGTLWESLNNDVIGHWARLTDDLTNACESRDLSSIVDADMAFHRDLMQKTERPDLESVWLSVAVRMRLQYSQHPDPLTVATEHRQILEAICAGNMSDATDRLRAHII